MWVFKFHLIFVGFLIAQGSLIGVTLQQLSNFSQREQFGYVFRAFDLNTSRMVTVKRIKLKGLEKKEVARRLLEIDILKQLSHPSIIKYEAMVQDENTLNTVFE